MMDRWKVSHLEGQRLGRRSLDRSSSGGLDHHGEPWDKACCLRPRQSYHLWKKRIPNESSRIPDLSFLIEVSRVGQNYEEKCKR